MNIRIPTNHNYYEEAPLLEKQLKEQLDVKTPRKLKKITQELFSSTFELTTKEATLKQIQIFGFKNISNKLEEDQQTILKLYSKENSNGDKQYFIQTGLFAGIIYHKGVAFNITTRYGDVFLKRMLNFINDIYVDNQQIKAAKSDETNEFQNIIAYLFIQSLEKAAVLGLPKMYKEQTQRSPKIRGKIDINEYLKKDFPFTGKLTTKHREQVYVQEIIDVLFFACKTLDKKFGKEINRKISGIFQLLKQNYSGHFPQSSIIEKANNHAVLQNPIYSTFKNALVYAEIILKEQNLLLKHQDNRFSTNGYLFNIAELFEVYLEKLLSKHFKNWYVIGQQSLDVYFKQFYGRRMFPDIVLRHKQSHQIIVFDAKFKTMRMIKKDVDRSDFYQIHSYIQYYQPKVLLGGLIYPLEKKLVLEKAHSRYLFAKKKHETAFIVDGIYIEETISMSEIVHYENDFLNRLDKIIHGKTSK